MTPAKLTAEQFKSYPPQAQALAINHLALLRQLPLVFLANLLREIIDFDYRFPVEKVALQRQLTYLAQLPELELGRLFFDFSRLRLSSDQEALRWVDQPLSFTEQLSAYLWSTDQMDAFRSAATTYGTRMYAAVVPESLPMSRLTIAIIGQGAASQQLNLFSKLRPYGTYFSRVNPDQGFEHLLAAVESRAQAAPVPYGHWYVDGGDLAPHSSRLTCVSYRALTSVRAALLDKIKESVDKPGMGPEELRDHLAALLPTQLGMKGDPVLDRFQVKVLTEGSGTQIFSTTFAQWTAREILRRAEALTLLVRFAPRQKQRPLNDLLANAEGAFELDYPGSLIDADIAAYYQWINQQRLPGADRSSFLVWFENQAQAVAIGPSMPRGVVSTSPLTLQELLSDLSRSARL